MDEVRDKNLVERRAMQEIVAFQAQRQANVGLPYIALEFGQRKEVRQPRQLHDRFDQPASQQCGQMDVSLEQPLLGIAGVAAEYFIAAVAGQHVRESRFARRLSAEIGGHCRVVAERLVVFTGDDGDCRHDVGGLQVVLVAAAAVALGGATGVFHFIESVGVEADGKSVDRRIARGSEGADHGGAVGAAGEKRCSGWCIGIAHGLIQHAAEIASMAVEVGVDRGVIGLPVKRGVDLPIFQREVLSGQKLVHALVQAARCGNRVEIKIIVDCLRVDDASHCRMGRHALHAAAEHQVAAVFGVTQAFGTYPIERQKGFFLQRFEHGKGEVAVHQGRQFFAKSHPAVRHRHSGILVTRDERQFIIQKARAPAQCSGQPVLNVNLGLAETRAARHAQHLATVFVQQPFR